MIRILVADKLAPQVLDQLRSMEGVQVDNRPGLQPDELSRAMSESDGMIIRSGVTITGDMLVHPGRLRAIARAGVGVDNVDLDAATNAGVLVLNTPEANTVSTAEHTLALLFAVMRHIPAAHTHVCDGRWERSAFMGRQLNGKTLGVIGMGRVGQAVAKRAAGCGMRVIGFDPLVGGTSVLDGDVKLFGSLKDVLNQADCITLHAKLTDDSRHMIGSAQLAMMKSTAVIVNCARGELLDEQALADALNHDRIAGAAIDVFSSEPPIGNPLLKAKNVVLTPHLGASTAEAQLAVAEEAARVLLDYLTKGEIHSAVNVSGIPASLTDHDRAYVDLCRRMGAILSPWCASGLDRLEFTTHGQGLQNLCQTLTWQCVTDLLSRYMDTRLNLVNAPTVAKQRGITVDSRSHASSSQPMETVLARIHTREGQHEIEGTVSQDGRPRILSIDQYRMEMVPERVLVLIFNDDRPGVVGLVGTVMGQHNVNIADMTLSRRDRTALMLAKLDQEPDESVLEQLRAAEPILSIRTVLLPPLET